MGKKPRRILIGIAAVLLLLLTAAALAIALVDWRARAESLASEVLGREVRLERISLDLGQPTRVSMGGLRVANEPEPAGPESSALLTLDSLQVVVRPLSILWGPVALPEISASGLQLDLARDESGRGNWLLGQSEEAAVDVVTPDSRAELPTLGDLSLTDAQITYVDAPSGIELEAHVDELSGRASPESVALNLAGSIAGRDLEAQFDGGALEQLRDAEKPYPVDLQLGYGASEVSVQGALSDPLELEGADLELRAEGPSVSELYPLIPTALPATPPFQVSGAVFLQEQRWSVQDLQGQIGDTDIAGRVMVEHGRERPALTAELRSRQLVVEDLRALVGANEERDQPEGSSQSEGLLPEVRLTAERLRALDFGLGYAAESVVYPPLPVTGVDLRATLDDGRLHVRLDSVALAEGQVSGEMALNAREEVPSADLDLELNNVHLSPFFKGTRFVEEMGGRVGGQLYLLGVGWTLADLLGSVRGQGRVHMQDGTVSGLVLEAAGLDVIEALGLVLEDDDPKVPLRCGVVEFEADQGVVKIARGLIDTEDSVLVIDGQVDLGAETLSASVRSRPKDMSVLDINAPVLVSGPLAGPSISIGDMEGLPFEAGTQEDLDCSQLLGKS